MDNIGADGDMHGYRHIVVNPGGEEAIIGIGRVYLKKQFAQCLSYPDAGVGGALDSLVHQAACLFPHPECSALKICTDILRSLADERNLEIVDAARAVKGESGNHTALCQCNQ